jgi:peptidoglycan/xylan/chitin deacetylase (PgdA/CDA1 family)
VVVTFDDGYLDNFEFALPVLKRHGVPATIYLVSSTLTNDRLLWTSGLRFATTHARVRQLQVPELVSTALPLDSDRDRATSARTLTNVLNQMPAEDRHAWVDRIISAVGAPRPPAVDRWFLGTTQIAEMREYGITFGAHTVTHPNLPGIPPDAAREEIVQSRSALSRMLGEDVAHFSYPNSGSLHPHVSDGVARAASDAGYASAVTSHKGVCRPTSDRFRLRRIGINRARSPLPRFTLMIEAARLTRDAGERTADE